MKVPCRWLTDYVDIEVTREGVERLAERLTLAGLEVEGIEETGTLSGVVVGRIVSARPHPDSDHLTLCRVDIEDREVDVVCGAPNVVEGGLVPLATVGAELPGGLRIERRKLRGEVSEGMICSKEELGLEERSDGIWIFDPALDLRVGTDLAELLEYDDFVLDFKVTSNRPDCDSVYGVAREIAAIYDRPLQRLDVSVTESEVRTSEKVRIAIEDPEDTPRY
ncbi:MAG TPA: phenylalanine--tRNA ligase subunit beta, partial [Candidatus Acetothermia bacterium]|nr:phenylalanine--tRNA ligase subunit beta [Candidatus Acetothermia bacterium]